MKIFLVEDDMVMKRELIMLLQNYRYGRTNEYEFRR